jgi:type II secretory pathway component PulM
MDAVTGFLLVVAVVFVVAILIGRAIVGWWFKIDESLAELRAMHAALDLQTQELKAIRGFFMPHTVETPAPAAPPAPVSTDPFAPRFPKG